jgi:cytochrome P450
MTAHATATAPIVDGLPPGTRMPSWLQLLGTIYRVRPMMARQRERYGDLYSTKLLGLGTFVVAADPALIRAAFTAPADVLVAGEANQLSPILGENSLLATDGDHHLRQRKLLLPPFHGARMKDYERMIEEIAREEIAAWPAGEAFPVLPTTMRITLRAILRAVFGAHDEIAARLERLLPVLTERGSFLSATPFLQRDLGRYSPWGNFLRMRAEVDGLLDQLIDEARRDPNVADRPDVLALLVQARYDDGQPMTSAEIRDQLVTMLAAGHETTATTLAWAVERLRRHPRVLAKLTQEVDAGGREYRDATVREIQRVRPVIMFTTRLVKKPFEIGGYRLAPGTRLALGGAVTHFDERRFPNPREFRPERFVGEKPGTYTWLPFGGGVRRCIGAAFAHLEMEVVLRTILDTYELVPTTAPPEAFNFRGVAYAPAEGGLIEVRPRARPSTPVVADSAALDTVGA